MTDKKNKEIADEKTEAMLEEIRTRVFDRYAEMRGVETQESALNATLEALQDITNVPRGEIEKIATEVQKKHLGLSEPLNETLPATTHTEVTELTFERLRKKVESGKQGFVFHLIPYMVVNTMLIYLNVISTSFPWAMFPVFGWGIGLASHFFAEVVYPRKDLKRKTEVVKNQIHQILGEGWSGYITDSTGKIFNNVYRLIVTECSKELLEEYIRNADTSLNENAVLQMSTQLISLQEQFVSKRKQKSGSQKKERRNHR